MKRFEWKVHGGMYDICQPRDLDDAVTMLRNNNLFFSLIRSNGELSVVCETGLIRNLKNAYPEWRLYELTAKTHPGQIGVVSAVTSLLNKYGINVVPLGNYDTDFMLVHHSQFDAANDALKESGHVIRSAS